MRRAIALAIVALAATSAEGQPRRGAPAAAPALKSGSTVALVPLASVQGDVRAPEAAALEGALATELTRAGFTVVAPAQVTSKIKAAKQPALRACDGDDACLKDVGLLVGATAVIAGEVGGLGDVQVVYLELVDVGTGAEVRRTQAPLGAGPRELEAAVLRLVDPSRHVGNLHVTTAIDGAVIFVDGRRVGRAPLAPMSLPVGAHALRVTHPDARDFVRFVDVEFGKTTAIDAELVRYEAIDTSISATGGMNGGSATATRGAPRSPAWYRRWWAVAGFSAVVLGGAIVAGTALADDVDADATGTVKP